MLKKQTYMIFILTTMAIMISIFVLFSVQKSVKKSHHTTTKHNEAVVAECEKRARDTELMTARIDKYQAGEETFFSCLISKNLDPYKYKWNEKEPSTETLERIRKMVNLKEESKK